MNTRFTVLTLGISALLLAGCVSTKTPAEKISLFTPPSAAAPTATPDASSIPTLVVHGNTTPTVSPQIKGKKTMTATLMDINTNKGTIEIELYPQDAPKTVENFATLASQGYYDGLTFHRVVD